MESLLVTNQTFLQSLDFLHIHVIRFDKIFLNNYDTIE